MLLWVRLENGSEGCIVTYDSKDPIPANTTIDQWVADRLHTAIVERWQIPYAAFPCLLGKDLTFCHYPKTRCRGRSSCPRNPVCCD